MPELERFKGLDQGSSVDCARDDEGVRDTMSKAAAQNDFSSLDIHPNCRDLKGNMISFIYLCTTTNSMIPNPASNKRRTYSTVQPKDFFILLAKVIDPGAEIMSLRLWIVKNKEFLHRTIKEHLIG